MANSNARRSVHGEGLHTLCAHTHDPATNSTNPHIHNLLATCMVILRTCAASLNSRMTWPSFQHATNSLQPRARRGWLQHIATAPVHELLHGTNLRATHVGHHTDAWFTPNSGWGSACRGAPSALDQAMDRVLIVVFTTSSLSSTSPSPASREGHISPPPSGSELAGAHEIGSPRRRAVADHGAAYPTTV